MVEILMGNVVEMVELMNIVEVLVEVMCVYRGGDSSSGIGTDGRGGRDGDRGTDGGSGEIDDYCRIGSTSDIEVGGGGDG